jgi:N-acetylneuraminate lyase
MQNGTVATDFLFGSDEMLLAALSLSANGAIGSTYNYAAPLYHELIRYYDEGNMEKARELQQRSVSLVQILVHHGVMASGKAIMKMIGVDCGPVRPPLNNLTRDGEKALYEDIARLDLFARTLIPPT